MLTSKRQARRAKRVDWYPIKSYKHFDVAPSRVNATKFVTDPVEVASHDFLPFITFDRIDRRYRRKKKGIEISQKVRRLAYCSNVDACVFSYYASILNNSYEDMIRKHALDKVVVGYRKNGSNIDIAMEAFYEIKSRIKCVAFAFDISGFFDDISHKVLKENWKLVLGCGSLPDDHYNVFKHITKYSSIDRRALLRRLGFDPKAKDAALPGPPLCSILEFRKVIRGGDGINVNLVAPGDKRKRGIPQGSPISAVAANISMLKFDLHLMLALREIGCSYRRYSDDILIVAPVEYAETIEPLIRQMLRTHAGGLEINDKKTGKTIFDLTKSPAAGFKPLQYLGFLYDGQKTLIRPNTISKYWRRVHQEVRRAKRLRRRALASGKLATSAPLHRKSLLRKTTHLGSDNIVATYVRSAEKKMNGKFIKRQFKNHARKINRLSGC